MTDHSTVRSEIEALRAQGETDILVSVDAQGEARWGDAAALSREDMERAMTEIGFSTEGMLTAEQFEARF